MRKVNYSSFITGILVMFVLSTPISCDEKDGYATPPEFAPKEFQLSGGKQTITLTAKNDLNWFLADLTVNQEILGPVDWDNDERIRYFPFKLYNPDNPYAHIANVNRIEFEDWFVWERIHNQKIKISLTENKGGRIREISFQASVGNASDRIYIVQNPE